MIGNELLKTAQTYLNPCLVKLFNAVFTSGNALWKSTKHTNNFFVSVFRYFSKIHFNTKMWSEVLNFFGLITRNFNINNQSIECVKTYKYLDIMLTSSGKFQQAQKVLFNKAMKASYKLYRGKFSKPKCQHCAA
jgi:hypothetical protein